MLQNNWIDNQFLCLTIKKKNQKEIEFLAIIQNSLSLEQLLRKLLVLVQNSSSLEQDRIHKLSAFSLRRELHLPACEHYQQHTVELNVAEIHLTYALTHGTHGEPWASIVSPDKQVNTLSRTVSPVARTAAFRYDRYLPTIRLALIT